MNPEGNKPNPTLAEALNLAREKGVQTREGGVNTFQTLKDSLRNRYDSARNRLTDTKASLSRIGGETKALVKTTIDIGIGLSTNQEARRAVGEAVRFNYDKANEAFDEKRNNILDIAEAKRDEVITRILGKMSEVGASFRDRLISPQVARAREITNNIQIGGQEMAQFFRSQAENTKNGFMARKAEIAADWHDLLSKPPELKASLFGKLGEKMTNFANGERETSLKRKSVAGECRGAAAHFRTSPA